MKKVNVNASKCYEVIIDDSFTGLSEELSRIFKANTVYFIITDKNVGPIYSNAIANAVKSSAGHVFELVVDAGENSKNIGVLSSVYEFLLANGADRSSVIIALGGGVIGDLAGFAASTYMRGIKYVQIPTTLLAQVDSSIGGKTAIDFSGYKNIIGAFYQPDLVYINVSVLETLPSREFSSGMAEVIKYGLIADADFYEYIHANIENIHDRGFLVNVVSRCVEIKARIVECDEFDTGIRETLNFGHTAGHAVEALKQFELLHGESVAVGMVAAMELSEIQEKLEETARFKDLLLSLGLPVETAGLNATEIYDAMLKDKKAKSGKISYVLLEGIGHACSSTCVTRSQILNALNVIVKEG